MKQLLSRREVSRNPNLKYNDSTRLPSRKASFVTRPLLSASAGIRLESIAMLLIFHQLTVHSRKR